jgi:predicted small metal-binding protein
MDVARQFSNRCACGWEFRGSRDAVVDATIDHGRRMHNMEATREQVLAALDHDAAEGDTGDRKAGGLEATVE